MKRWLVPEKGTTPAQPQDDQKTAYAYLRRGGPHPLGTASGHSAE